MADEDLKKEIQDLLDKTDLDEKAVAFGKKALGAIGAVVAGIQEAVGDVTDAISEKMVDDMEQADQVHDALKQGAADVAADVQGKVAAAADAVADKIDANLADAAEVNDALKQGVAEVAADVQGKIGAVTDAIAEKIANHINEA